MNKALKKPKKTRKINLMGSLVHYPFVGLLLLTIPVGIISFHTFTSLTHAHTPRHVFEKSL
jgi:hypothetical protein